MNAFLIQLVFPFTAHNVSGKFIVRQVTQQSKKLEHTEASCTVARDGKVGSELQSISPPDNGNSHLAVRKLRHTSATQLTPYHQANNFFPSKCHRSAAPRRQPLWHNFFRLGATINLDGSTSRHETVERKSLLMANESSRNLLVSYPTPWNASDRLRRRQKSTCRYSKKEKHFHAGKLPLPFTHPL